MGRREELRQLDRACDLDAVGVTVLDGPDGSGKTHLLTDLATRARAQGLRVLAVRAGEFEPVPFGLVAELLDGAAEPFDARVVARQLTETLAATPTLLLVDDVQWADSASVAVLGQLLTRALGRYGLVLAHRSGECPPHLTGPLDAANRVSVQPLSTVDAAALLSDEPDARRWSLVELADGNPLHLLLLRELDDDALRSAPSLDATADLLVAGLGERERRVAVAASLTLELPQPDLLAAITELDVTAVRAALDRLAGRGLLTANGFRHPLLRAAAYRRGAPPWHERAHQQVLGWLRRHHAPVLARAPHAVRVLAPGDDASAGELLSAGELAMTAAPDASAQWLAAVLRVQERGSESWVSAAMRLGHALLLSGRPADAIRLLADAREFSGTHHRSSLMLQAHAERMRGRAQRAKELIEQAAALPGGDTDATVQLELARLDIQDNRQEEGTARVIAMLQSSAVTDDLPMRVAATCLTSIGMIGSGSIEYGRGAYQEAAKGLDQLTDAQLCDIVDAVPAWAWAGFFLGEHAGCLPRVERALEVAARYGHSYALPLVHTVHAELLGQAGRLADALEATDIARETAELFGYPDVLPMAGAIRLRVLLQTDDQAAALEQWRTLNRMARPAMLWWSRVVDAELAASAVALGMRDRYPRGLLEDGANPLLPTRLLGATTAALARDDVDAATAYARRAQAAAEATRLPVQLAAAALARARCSFATRDLDAARAAATIAADGFQTAGMPIQHGQAVHLLAKIAAMHG